MSPPIRARSASIFTRCYDLDWLRIIAFGLLIFYHVGRFFDTEGWHAKSEHASAIMEPTMWLSTPWRLPLLFFISGVAIRFLSDKMGSAKFAGDRFLRLFPVIVFGMYVIVAPQSYSELVGNGEIGTGFWSFYQSYAGEWGGPWSIHTPTWNHLWYVVYLFVYSLLLAPLFPLLRWCADSSVMRAVGRFFKRPILGPIMMIALPALPFLVIRYTLSIEFETTHALFDDWANHANSLTILLMGYLFAKNEALWRAVDRALPWAGSLTIVSMAFLFVSYSNWEMVEPNTLWLQTARIDRIVYAWAIILTMLGLARRYLNQDGPLRRYLTQAIFPYYILHQTIIVGVGYAIGGLGLGIWSEFAVLLAATIIGCGLGFELIRRVPVLRSLMGLKWGKPKPVSPISQVAE